MSTAANGTQATVELSALSRAGEKWAPSRRDRTRLAVSPPCGSTLYFCYGVGESQGTAPFVTLLVVPAPTESLLEALPTAVRGG